MLKSDEPQSTRAKVYLELIRKIQSRDPRSRRSRPTSSSAFRARPKRIIEATLARWFEQAPLRRRLYVHVYSPRRRYAGDGYPDAIADDSQEKPVCMRFKRVDQRTVSDSATNAFEGRNRRRPG
ncbi:MAG: hypothetical protein MZU97_04325 [Bacillus subtilis]|nr:hypothetical protein [Bacillus subtilis]